MEHSTAPQSLSATCRHQWGYWGEELVGPVEVLDQAGYAIDFATPTGKRPIPISVSMDPEFVDPPLGRSVTTPSSSRPSPTPPFPRHPDLPPQEERRA
jgi:putative intracellular protease/amidase